MNAQMIIAIQMYGLQMRKMWSAETTVKSIAFKKSLPHFPIV
jgi:hypothetical protein